MRIVYEDRTRLFETIVAIHEASFTKMERAPREMLRDAFDQAEIFVRVDLVNPFSQYVAYALLTEKLDEPYIWSIATDAGHRGLGHAGALLVEIEQFVRVWRKTASSIGLTVHVNNITAQRLYLDNGYRVEQVLSNHYGPGESGLVMRRTL
jgi:ribosomal protein S18 acetylase RimI-like enzyme